jgi:serine/threonine protein kinase
MMGSARRAEYLAPGTRLGKYELVRLLAAGGMAEIHLAHESGMEGFEKLVVLKRILPHLSADADFVRMFLREARLAATLHHPNIVEMFDFGQEDGSYFMVMEYVRGRDLGEVVRTAARAGRGLALADALAIVVGVAQGLHHAHEQCAPDGNPLGIVHRDISPSNVLITFDGCIKVCDFGIAKAVASRGKTGAGTERGIVRGKIEYMSPEQCRNEPLDRRSDIFAIGILLYELTTGQRLFRGQSDYEILHQIVSADIPPPTSIRPEYPPALERVVMRALHRDAAERQATALELQNEIEELARQHGLELSSAALGRYMCELFGECAAEATGPIVRASAPRSAGRGRARTMAAGVALGVLAAAALIVTLRRSPAADMKAPPVATIPSPTVTPAATTAAQTVTTPTTQTLTPAPSRPAKHRAHTARVRAPVAPPAGDDARPPLQ